MSSAKVAKAPTGKRALAGRHYLTPAEVAEYFAVATKRVLRWIDGGQLEAVCASVTPASRRPQYRITPEAVERFEAARAVAPPAPPRRRRQASWPHYV